MACSKCTSGCTGACAPGCTGACSVECSTCASSGTCHSGCTVTCNWNCSGCSGCGSGCATGCSGCGSGCAGGCNDQCTTTCTGCDGACTNTCKNYCNKGCSSSAMAISLTQPMQASNIKAIGDLVMFEVSRRPSAGAPTDTSSLFSKGGSIRDEDVAKIVANLVKAGQSIAAPAQGDLATVTFGNNLISKLLAANAQQVNIP